MRQPSKSRPKRPPEPLDWKELASGPALRGLTDVLATTPEVARDRAARRMALEDVGNRAVETPTVVEATAMTEVATSAPGPATEAADVGVTPTVEQTTTVPEVAGTSGAGPAPLTIGETPTVADTTAVSETSHTPDTLIGSPTAVETPTVPVSLASYRVSTTNQGSVPLAHIPPTVGDTPRSAGLAPSTATEPLTPTVGVMPTVQTAEVTTSATAAKLTASSSDNAHSGESTTVGVSPVIIRVPFGSALWVDAAGIYYEQKRVQRVHIAQHSMTLGEERFYQAVWHAKETDGVYRDGVRAKRFSMGYDRLARLVRLDEKSVRQLIPKLIQKKILELLAAEDSASRQGRTYRIFSYEEILERQRSADLQYVVKRGRAVEFVTMAYSPTVGVSPTHTITPTVPVSTPHGNPPSVGSPPTLSVGLQPAESVGVTPTPLVRVSDIFLSQASSSVAEALRQYAAPDDDAIRAIISRCVQVAHDATVAEIVHFIHEKGRAVRGGRITNPLAYLIIYVPKCFQGESFRQHRQHQQSAKEREARAVERAEAELAEMRAQWQAWLDDPTASEEDREWARQMLANQG